MDVSLVDFGLSAKIQSVDIYEEITRLRREGRRGALATIINVRGSIPSFE